MSMPVLAQLRTIAVNPHFRSLILIKITHLLALSIGAGSLVFFFRFVMGHDLQTLGVYGAITTIVWAILMPVWTRIANVRGKRFGYFVATVAYAVVTLSWLLAENAESMMALATRGIAFGIISGGTGRHLLHHRGRTHGLEDATSHARSLAPSRPPTAIHMPGSLPPGRMSALI